jgi:hypothetical protein
VFAHPAFSNQHHCKYDRCNNEGVAGVGMILRRQQVRHGRMATSARRVDAPYE